ncbi:hypothetical protein L2E82_48969 [Cichorium intybus]|uniref:Uncharacterized protein n=1 Tax=Cichorium intybus TaxID=13427 RepID=A0ACB8YZP2_CICIN|nr:hypothetical protein L2E82_48969 [Cichorium intybus]
MMQPDFGKRFTEQNRFDEIGQNFPDLLMIGLDWQMALKPLLAMTEILRSNSCTIGATLLIVHQLIATPMLYDFYNYDIEKKEFLQLFIKFTQ